MTEIPSTLEFNGIAEAPPPRKLAFTPVAVQALRQRYGDCLATYFSPEFYVSTYPDLAQVKDDLLLHFCNYGFAENRTPSPFVSTSYCRWLAKARGTPLQSAQDLFELLDGITAADWFGPHAMLCPIWIRAQLGEDVPPATAFYHLLLRSADDDRSISFHPALPPVATGGEELRESFARTDRVALLSSCFLDLTDYCRHHKDLLKLGAGPARLFEHAFGEGLPENRLKYLGTGAPRWASLDDLFRSAAVLVLRNSSVPYLQPAGSALHCLPSQPVKRLASPPGDLQRLLDFKFGAQVAWPSDGLLLELNTIVALKQNAVASSVTPALPDTASGRGTRIAELTDMLLGSSIAGPEPTKRVVYSVCIGGYDDLPTPPQLDSCSYFLITDAPAHLVRAPWRIVRPTLRERDIKRLCLWYKTHPHLLFPDAEFVVWIDANVDCHPGSERVLAAHETLSEVATFKHPDRICVFDEAKAIIDLKLDDRSVVEAHVKKLKAAGMPERYGAFETNVLFSRARDLGVRQFFDTWWSSIFFGSRRDQLSFTFASWKRQIEVSQLDGNQSAKTSRFFSKRPHKTPIGRVVS